MMRLCLYPVLWLVNCLIALLAALGIGLEWGRAVWCLFKSF
ncbi:hypothetical protein ACFQDZ_00645 [Sulfitobacter pacificus]